MLSGMVLVRSSSSNRSGRLDGRLRLWFSTIRRRQGHRNVGAIMPLFALTFAFLLLFLGLVADGGSIYLERRRAQVAADAGAYGGALELLHNNSSWVGASARADTKFNGFDDAESDVVISVNNPPLSGAAAGDNTAVEVIVQRTVPTTLMMLVANESTIVRARAVAAVRPETGPLCILALSETEQGAITFNGTVDMNIPECEIIARSTHADAILGLGTPCVTAKSISYAIGGGSSQNGQANCLDPQPTAIIPPEDPYKYLPTPDPSTYVVQSTSRIQRNNTDGAETFQPGVYQGGIKLTGGGPYTFAPGMYIVDGLEISGGSAYGDDVTFYNTTDGLKNIVINGNTSVQLSAPTTGIYKNMLFFQNRNSPLGNPYDGLIVGDSSSTFEGVIYAPANHIDFGGNSGTNGDVFTQIIADTLRFHGTAKVSGDFASLASDRTPSTQRASFVE